MFGGRKSRSSLSYPLSRTNFPWDDGAFANIRRSAPISREPNGTERKATVVAQAKSTVPPKTIIALAMAGNAAPSRAYCSQTTNT